MVGVGVALFKRKPEAEGAAPPAVPPAPPKPGLSVTGTLALPSVLTQYPVPSVPSGVPAVQTIVQPAPSTADDQSIVTAAVQTGDPNKMRQVAAVLRQKGNAVAAASLESYATSSEVASSVVQSGLAAVNQILQGRTQTGAPGVPAPTPVPAQPQPAQPTPTTPVVVTPQPTPTAGPVTFPGMPSVQDVTTALQQLPGLLTGFPGTAPAVPVPVPTPSVPVGVTWPESDPIKYAAALKANQALKGKGPWKESTADKNLVKAFQSQEGLTADGLWGADSAIHMGTNYGIVPVKPFYWPKDTSKVAGKKAEYRAAMMAAAAKDPMRASEWTAAASV